MKLEVHIDEVSREQWELHAKMFADYSIYQTWPYQQVRAEMDRQSVSRAIVTDEQGNPITMCQVRIKTVKALRLRIGYVQWGPLLRRRNNFRYSDSRRRSGKALGNRRGIKTAADNAGQPARGDARPDQAHPRHTSRSRPPRRRPRYPPAALAP